MLRSDLSIGEMLTRLAVARGGLVDDVTGDVYLDGLEDLTPRFVEEACRRLSLEPRAPYEPVLPQVGTIRRLAKQIADEEARDESLRKLLPMPASEEHEHRYFCLNCFDEPSAWRLFWCPGFGSLLTLERKDETDTRQMCECGIRRPHGPHGYAERCACAETNPVIAKYRQRRAEQQQRRAS